MRLIEPDYVIIRNGRPPVHNRGKAGERPIAEGFLPQTFVQRNPGCSRFPWGFVLGVLSRCDVALAQWTVGKSYALQVLASSKSARRADVKYTSQV